MEVVKNINNVVENKIKYVKKMNEQKNYSPSNGANLVLISKSIFYDELTGQNFTIKAGRLSQIVMQE